MAGLLLIGQSSEVERAKHAAQVVGLTLPNSYCREKVGQRKAILY